MDRINGADTVDIGSGRRGFIDEDLAVGQPGTEVTALWLNMTQEEIAYVIETSGLVLNPGDWTQLWQALRILGFSNSNVRWSAIKSMTLSSAPGAPVVGDTYLIPSGATGLWTDHAGKLAQWNGQGWSYGVTPDGHGVGLPQGRVFIKIDGEYQELTATGEFKGLVSLNQIKQASGDAFKQASTRVDATHVPLVPLPVNNVETVVPPVSLLDDGQGDWALVGNRVVCQRAGRYLFNLSFGANSTGAGFALSGGLDLNGVEFLWGSIRLASQVVLNLYAGGSAIRDIEVGDWLEFQVYQEGMSTESVLNYRTRASMLRLAV